MVKKKAPRYKNKAANVRRQILFQLNDLKCPSDCRNGVFLLESSLSPMLDGRGVRGPS